MAVTLEADLPANLRINRKSMREMMTIGASIGSVKKNMNIDRLYITTIDIGNTIIKNTAVANTVINNTSGSFLVSFWYKSKFNRITINEMKKIESADKGGLPVKNQEDRKRTVNVRRGYMMMVKKVDLISLGGFFPFKSQYKDKCHRTNADESRIIKPVKTCINRGIRQLQLLITVSCARAVLHRIRIKAVR